MESQLGVGQQQQQRAGQVRLLPWVVARVVECTTPPLSSACVGRHCAVERELGEEDARQLPSLAACLPPCPPVLLVTPLCHTLTDKSKTS